MVVAEFVLASLERHYPPVAIKVVPSADAIVILGGVTRGVVPGTGLTDLDGGVDRLVHGARLFKAGKAPVIILSGGNAPGYQPESEAMAEILLFMGIPLHNMLLESESRNTWQNGLNTIPILKEQGILGVYKLGLKRLALLRFCNSFTAQRRLQRSTKTP